MQLLAFSVLWILLSWWAAAVAEKRGHDFWTVFVLALLISPLFLAPRWFRSRQRHCA